MLLIGNRNLLGKYDLTLLRPVSHGKILKQSANVQRLRNTTNEDKNNGYNRFGLTVCDIQPYGKRQHTTQELYFIHEHSDDRCEIKHDLQKDASSE